MVLGPAESPGNLFEMQIRGPHYKPMNQKLKG